MNKSFIFLLMFFLSFFTMKVATAYPIPFEQKVEMEKEVTYKRYLISFSNVKSIFITAQTFYEDSRLCYEHELRGNFVKVAHHMPPTGASLMSAQRLIAVGNFHVVPIEAPCFGTGGLVRGQYVRSLQTFESKPFEIKADQYSKVMGYIEVSREFDLKITPIFHEK